MLASMGPPSMNGGRQDGPKQGADAVRCFNGAAVDERRKGETFARTVRALLASMGPPSMNGGRLGATERTHPSASASMGPPSMNGGRFGGATLPLFRETASMGPPSMNGGRSGRGSPTPPSGTGFNGAAVDERRKDSEAGEVKAFKKGLQWGRRR